MARSIICGYVDNAVTRDTFKLLRALRNKSPIILLDRDEVQSFADQTGNENWKRLASMPPLFELDETSPRVYYR